MSAAKAKALMICCTGPDPNGTGLEQRTFQHYWCLSQLFSVDLVIQPRNAAVLARANAAAAKFGAKVLPIIDQQHYRISPSAFGATLMREILGLCRSDWPVYTKSKQAQALSALQERLDQTYRLVFCMRLDTAWYLSHLETQLPSTTKYVIDLDDLDSRFLRQYAQYDAAERGRELVAATKMRAARIENAERKIFKSFDTISFASEQDTKAARAIAPQARIVTLTNCLELRQVPLPVPSKVKPGLDLLFVGSLGYVANSDAILYFAREILPLIRRQADIPVRLTIAGQSPPADVQALDDPPNTIVTGWVESLIPLYAEADICILPIRIGSGTRFKALEALNLGRPIVSTTLGVEGLGLLPETHYLRGDTPQAFAEACIRIARDKALGDSLATNGRQRVRDEFSRAAALGRLKAALDAIGVQA